MNVLYGADDASGSYDYLSQHGYAAIAKTWSSLGRGAIQDHGDGASVVLSSDELRLDLGNYAVSLFGHGRTPVHEALIHALSLPVSSSRLLGNMGLVMASRELLNVLPRTDHRLNNVWFGTGGSEVVDLAMKLALRVTRKNRFLAVERAFHGKSLASASVTWSRRYDAAHRSLIDVDFLDPEDAGAVSKALEGKSDYAALIFEPVQGEGGGRVIQAEVLARWVDDARGAGLIVIADEIQSGFYRCGPVSKALEDQLEVDVLLLGKGLGGGVAPASAAIFTDRAWAPMACDPYFHTSTFSAHPLTCASVVASIRYAESLRESADEVAGFLEGLTMELSRELGHLVVKTSSVGLFGVIEFRDSDLADKFIARAGREGVIVCPCISWPASVRILPPMNMSRSEMDQAYAALMAVARKIGRFQR